MRLATPVCLLFDGVPHECRGEPQGSLVASINNGPLTLSRRPVTSLANRNAMTLGSTLQSARVLF